MGGDNLKKKKVIFAEVHIHLESFQGKSAAFYKITQTIMLYDYNSILPFHYKSPHFIYPNYKTQAASPQFLLAVAELRKLK